MVIKAFQVTGISLALDGSENHLLRNEKLLQQALSLEEEEREAEEEQEKDKKKVVMLTLRTKKWKRQMSRKTPLQPLTLR